MLKLCYLALAAGLGAAIGATAPDSWRGVETVAAQSAGVAAIRGAASVPAGVPRTD